MEYEMLQEALRVLFLVGAPIVLITAAVGTIVSGLMAATTIQEQALSYAVRLAVVVLVLYMMMPLAARSLTTLGEMALR